MRDYHTRTVEDAARAAGPFADPPEWLERDPPEPPARCLCELPRRPVHGDECECGRAYFIGAWYWRPMGLRA